MIEGLLLLILVRRLLRHKPEHLGFPLLLLPTPLLAFRLENLIGSHILKLGVTYPNTLEETVSNGVGICLDAENDLFEAGAEESSRYNE